MSHLFLTLPCGFKAAQCSSQPIPSGRRVPIFRSGVGCGFRLWPRWETASRFDCKFRVAFSAQALNRKPCPVSQPNTGMHFPLSPSTGKCIPFHSQIPGRLSEIPPIRKARPTVPTSGHGAISPLARPRLCNVAPARRRNIRFIASSARAGEHLMCSPCEQDCSNREPYIPPTGRRYMRTECPALSP